MVYFDRIVKYQSERDDNFDKTIMSYPGCERLDSCIQCGTCSAICPMSIYMDYTPRQVVYLTRAGFKNEIIKSKTPWICSACYSCIVSCPKKIKVTDVMYAIRREALKENITFKKFAVPILINEFYNMVLSKGRVSECKLALKLFLKSNWLMIFKMKNLGLGLIRTRRFSLKSESIHQPERMKQLLKEMTMTCEDKKL